mmetsp:Transcript_106373/g.227160  ORF Transcript_106373/g.227160 Transcript_106373/m.227160 type:complete len:303 (-) Transcript_106373:88-996(-)
MASQTAEFLRQRQQRQEGLDLLNNGRFVEAEAALRVACEQTRAQNNGESWVWMRRMAESLAGQEKYDEAEPFARKARACFGRNFGPDEVDTLDASYLLAEILHGRMKQDPSLQSGDEALKLAEPAMKGMSENMKRGPEHPTTLKCKALVAILFSGSGKPNEAQSLAQTTFQTLEFAIERMKAKAAKGGLRPTPVEEVAMTKAREMLANVLSYKKMSQTSELVRETVKNEKASGDPGLAMLKASHMLAKVKNVFKKKAQTRLLSKDSTSASVSTYARDDDGLSSQRSGSRNSSRQSRGPATAA